VGCYFVLKKEFPFGMEYGNSCKAAAHNA
jgi:hypothetical protein